MAKLKLRCDICSKRLEPGKFESCFPLEKIYHLVDSQRKNARFPKEGEQ